MRRLYENFKYSNATFCIRYNFAMRRLCQNFKSFGLTVLPTEQLKVANFLTTISHRTAVGSLKFFCIPA
ncbi:hypothetical protein O3M35_007913 [Rhynocoris fuscipes]|uniref:Uncharacterized protein n=1 Tax=Rhynocoris fuscipes TaxID=488301 RepID=A0AAW1DBV9_9HEMI